MAGILDMITPEISYRKSGKQDIAGTPLKIDSEILDAILKLDIPIKDKWNLIGKYERHKVRDQIGLGDQEIFVGEGGNRKRMIGAEYNPKGQGISGLIMKDIDSGDTEGRIEYNKIVDFNKMLSNFMGRR